MNYEQTLLKPKFKNDEAQTILYFRIKMGYHHFVKVFHYFTRSECYEKNI